MAAAGGGTRRRHNVGAAVADVTLGHCLCFPCLQVPGATTYLGCVGKDHYADELTKVAAQDGVQAHYMIDEATPTGTCAACIVGGERSLVANLAAANNYKVGCCTYPAALLLLLPTAQYRRYGGDGGRGSGSWRRRTPRQVVAQRVCVQPLELTAHKLPPAEDEEKLTGKAAGAGGVPIKRRPGRQKRTSVLCQVRASEREGKGGGSDVVLGCWTQPPADQAVPAPPLLLLLLLPGPAAAAAVPTPPGHT